MISKEDQDLIDRLKKVGYGWGKYASSVERQKRVTEKQREVMLNMEKRIAAQKEAVERRQEELKHSASRPALPDPFLTDPLYYTAAILEGGMQDSMAGIAYQNAREFEHTRNRGSVDGRDVLFGGPSGRTGMFCDMGYEDDDEDVRPW